MTPDSELLRQFAYESSDGAFTELVHRYTDLVYSAAVRQVAGDAHLAQDVAQRVFGVLARKAGALAGRSNIVGWLHTTTRHCASVVVRTERRRRARDQAAFTMLDQPTGIEIDWSRLQPVLDEEIYRLGRVDREAVLLRYFQGKSHREVGTALGLSEDLARKRIERAIEKLRISFSRRGLGVSSAVLAETITAYSVQAAPVGLAANLASLTLANAAPVGVMVTLGQSVLIFMKTKIIAITAMLVLGLLIYGTWQWSQPPQLDDQKIDYKNHQSSALEAQPAIEPAAVSSVMGSFPGTVNGSVTVSPDARAALDVTILDILQLVQDKNYRALVQKYVPRKKRTEEQMEAIAQDPATAEAFQSFADILQDVKNVEPVFGANGGSARLRSKPDAAALVFIQQDGSWHLSGIEYPVSGQPASASAQPGQKKNADPHGDGYVP